MVPGRAVATPFGPVAAPRLHDGTRVEVLIRPEALRITPANGGGAPEGAAGAHILTVRMLRRAASSIFASAISRAATCISTAASPAGRCPGSATGACHP